MGFFDDTREMKALIKKNVREGHGSRAVARAQEEFTELQAARAEQPERQRPRHGRTFLLSFLFGALWSGSRRR